MLGLGYLRFAPGADPVSVPVRAKVGDQVLEPCNYATENGGYEADCGPLVVPENRANVQSRLIALPVTGIHARSEQPAEPILRLEGGPGRRSQTSARALTRPPPVPRSCTARSSPR